MFRIDNATAISPIPAPAAVGPNPNYFFTKGNPGLSIPATVVDDDWCNAVQEELCNAITGAGITLDKTVRTQLRDAIALLGGINRSALADTGAANAYAVAPTPAIAAYANGQKFSFVPANTNTTTSTLAVNGLAAKTIVLSNGDNLRPGDIKAAGLNEVVYQAALGKFILMNPSTPAYVTTAGNGYFRIPGTPFSVCWTQITSPAGAGSAVSMPGNMNWYNIGNVNFPFAFPNACLWVQGEPETTNDTYFWLFQGNKNSIAWNSVYLVRNTNAITMFATPLFILAIGW